MTGWAIRSAFLLVWAKRGGLADAPALKSVQERRIRGLGFEPADHFHWSDDSGSIAVGAWQDPSSRWDETAWHVTDDRVAMAVGHAWWRDGAGRPLRRVSAASLADADMSGSLADTVEHLRGIFAILRCSASGDAAVATDPLGFRCLYYGESADVVAVSSRAQLVAKALAGTERPVKDAVGACWLAYTTYRVGYTTGFDGVQVVPPGAVVEIRPGRGMRITRNAPWMPDPRWDDLGTDDLVELARDEIAASLRAILELPAERHVIGLTGGKDSRLILAVALWAGLAHDFESETIGPPDLPDVRVASELAERFGLRHDARFVGLGPERPYVDRIRDFVAATGGMFNIWDLSDPTAAPDEVRVVGLCGEALRAFRRFPTPPTSTKALLRLFAPELLGRLRLVRPEVAEQLHRTLLGVLLDDPSGRAEPIDLFDVFHILHRIRLSRTGPREELPGQLRVMPLYSIAVVQAAFSLGGPARQTELLHREVMRRCSVQLAEHPFAGPGWRRIEEPVVHRPGDTVSARPERRIEEPPHAAKPEALMARLQHAAFDDRKHVFLSVLEDRTNQAWELINREAAIAALQRFPVLKPKERRELYGAMTAALWLGEDG